MNNTLDERKAILVLISQVQALRDTIQSTLNNSIAQEHSRYVSFKSYAITYNDLAERARQVLKISTVFYTFNTRDMKSYMDTLWGYQKQVMEQVLLCTKLLLSALEGSVDFVNDEFDNIGNFIQTHLRAAIYQQPEKETEVQNTIENLLIGRGLAKGADYDRESGKFEFSGKEYIPDFIIPKMNLCIEVKLLKEGRRSKMVEEISADITAYKKQYERILFIVYDLGVIRDEVEFKRDIEMTDGVKVVVVKH